MDLYDKCLQFSKSLSISNEQGSYSSLIENENNSLTLATIENTESFSRFDSTIYYISDIHLVHHILYAFPNGATDEDVVTYIHSIVHGLFEGDFLIDVNMFKNPIVLFGGDISSSFPIAEMFFKEFVEHWDYLAKLKYESIVADLEERKYAVDKWMEAHPNECANTDFPEDIIELKKDISYLEYNIKEYHRRQNSRTIKKRSIYAILGNHEFWDFDSVVSCVNAYRELFCRLGICFLHNNKAQWLYGSQFPAKDIQEDSELYDSQMSFYHNAVIVGGVGFAGQNLQFNADDGIYQGALTRQEEIEETKKWMKEYENAIQIAKKKQCYLIVLTHNPLMDWKSKPVEDCNCAYFSGHTHRNIRYLIDENNAQIISDNQIGYKNKKIIFKKALLHKDFNPYASLPDGVYETTTREYMQFYSFTDEWIKGCGTIKHQIEQYGARLYVIKEKGYYGFFLIGRKATYICIGGSIRTVSKCTDITKFQNDFLRMINIYIQRLEPYRAAQEKISSAIKSFGGSGRIHGAIIDVDFFNHVSLNPFDKKITYYFSPMFGIIQEYNDLAGLLDANCPELVESYRKHLCSSQELSTLSNNINIMSDMIRIDVKNSIYPFSNRMNQLQRLFTKHILRDWNEDLLLEVLSIDD
ncbi:MAG: metallophosphoesterase [Oscillospiraceae bacterium]|nr:metallophosphoesterase [Oscillospiraceae bacterium]